MERKGSGKFFHNTSSKDEPPSPLADAKVEVDRDDETKIDFGVTKSEIELADMENFNRVTDFMAPPEAESKGDIETSNEMQNKADAEKFKNEGNALMKLGTDFHGAVLAYTKAISLSRNNYILYNNRAAAYIVNQDYQDAVNDCDISLGIKENLKAHCRRGQALGRLDRYSEALDSVNRALKMKAEDAEAKGVKKTLLRDQEIYEETLKVDKFKAEGNTLLQKQDFSGAVKAYTSALALTKSNYVVYNNRAVAHLMSGNYEKAIEDCDHSLDIKRNSKAYCRKAEALRKCNRIEAAVDMINAALKLNKLDSEALRIREDLLEEQEMFESDAMLFYNIQERCAADIVMECMEDSN
mmetsp:Transcript_19970/g.33659  ORF Transcript_19970/g.33659 Transcript_19970/m.33659 type:complete len:354 (-) Transcript_19970:199-1260(-)|eukprot:CAMPEP_0114455184 /NCGR_PEP_ID=MMETSP0104-20121206/2966_1 /TAXON_ID=37642 ORGANISM="Paraphysomonas imperforata, Strain PA2" /NCGR_SAMPLE_ID=MMETSP0104 /ASSEMBLY_ACC=CAM_ASM_000202 /LENGTH=353 /DNA_ID=CAMNT_0001627591 /DNA_START=98 /DNA_END=1159 /DNA_ORIENTATION=-